jgi:hypothetical protein
MEAFYVLVLENSGYLDDEKTDKVEISYQR